MEENMLSKILSLNHFNSERRNIVIPMIKTYLQNYNNFKCDDDLLNYRYNGDSKDFLSNIFKIFDNLIINGLTGKDILNYSLERYLQFDYIFEEEYGLSIKDFILFSYTINTVFTKNSKKFGEPIFYNITDEERYNINFIKLPTAEYIENWKNVYSFTFEDIFKILKKDNYVKFNIFMSLYNLNESDLLNLDEIRFKEKPFIKLKDRYFLLDSNFFIQYLPYKLHTLLSSLKGYNSKKGYGFENIAYDILRKIPNSQLFENFKYKLGKNEYESDGLLNFKNSSWFIELKCRQVSNKSYLGNRKNILKDLEKSFKDSIKQGERSIFCSHLEDFKKFDLKPLKGIIIVLEGSFPNVRFPPYHENILMTYGKTPWQNSDYPIYVINYFELNFLLKQPESFDFENYILWRTQKDMPLYCLEDCDYWSFYFDRYLKEKIARENFRLMKEKNNTTIYISKRFK
jgi:hypothetical protein